MFKLVLLGLGLGIVMVIADCGGRTPLEEAGGDPFSSGSAGAGSKAGQGGGSSTGPMRVPPDQPGSSGSGTAVGTAGSSGIGGSFSTGTGGFVTGGGGASMAGTGGAAVTGAGGFGIGGSASVDAGLMGTGGSPTTDPIPQLIGLLPGVRATPECAACAETQCNAAIVQCATDPVCLKGLACATGSCEGGGGRRPNLPGCIAMCFGGPQQSGFPEAITAAVCLYGTCQRQCLR